MNNKEAAQVFKKAEKYGILQRNTDSGSPWTLSWDYEFFCRTISPNIPKGPSNADLDFVVTEWQKVVVQDYLHRHNIKTTRAEITKLAIAVYVIMTAMLRAEGVEPDYL